MTIAEELAAARAEGVLREENLPFLLEPRQEGGAGVLLVHGFTATPWEMRAFGESLAAAGYRVLGVRLAGHGTTPEDLAGRCWEEWLASVERGYRILAGRCRRVYGAGLSTGALLLLHVAKDHAMAGLVLLSPYLQLRHPLARATAFLQFVHPFQKHRVPLALRPFYYERRPVHGVYQLCRLLRQTRRILPDLNAPTLVIGALGDRVIRLDSLLDLFRRLGSRQRQLHLFGGDVPHILVTSENPRQDEVFAMARRFIDGLEENSAG